MSSFDRIVGEVGVSTPKNLLRKALDQVVPEIEAQMREDLPNYKEVRHDFCVDVNGRAVTALMNKYRLPGMLFRMEGYKGVFRDPSWKFHGVGIVLLEGDPTDEQATYATFDETNVDASGAYFLRIGTLRRLSAELKNQFGGDWNLDFVPQKLGPQFSVPGKIENAQRLINQGKTVSYERDVHYPGMPNKNKNLPLGMTVLAVDDGLENPRIREIYTYGHA